MEHTEGLGRVAEVWVDGTLLTVCDGISAQGVKCSPGPLEHVSFRLSRDEGLDWNEAVLNNRYKKISFDHVDGWSYYGFGRVLSVMPVVMDFGLFSLSDPEWSTDSGLVGLYVAVPVSRLEIVPAPDEDYPE